MTFSITRDTPFPLVGIIFPLFGFVFIGIGIANTVFHYKNATSKNRMSLLDITDEREEPDPLNVRFNGNRSSSTSQSTEEDGNVNDSVRKYQGDFCPFCGTKVQDDFDFCPKCGKDI